MPLPFEDSRRLTGANLYFSVPAAVLSTAPGVTVGAEALARWRDEVARWCRELDWPAADCATRLRDGVGALAITAPVDQLFTATEVNEWALCRAMEGAPAATGEADAGPFHAPAYPALWDDDSARHTLRLAARAERRPALIALLHEAQRRHLPILLDDEQLTLGEGAFARTFALETLPPVDDVAWDNLRAIPVALVTGSNGKTTTTRLIARMSELSQRRTAISSTDGVVIGGEIVASGDYSGPAGARVALRDARSAVAVLETARGGILRRGLAVERVQAAIVTNIRADHFGEYGVHSLDDLADVKLVVARALAGDGILVLNADDALLTAKARGLASTTSLAWFALDADHPLLCAARSLGLATCGVRDGILTLHARGREHTLGSVVEMPLSANATAIYNVANLAGAALVAHALGLDTSVIASVCMSFGASNSDNPGRLMRWTLGTSTVLLDYAHNPDGLLGLFAAARGLHAHGRLAIVLGQAGNREDSDIRELAATAARHAPDVVVLKELASFARGRADGEVVALLRNGLQANGIGAERIEVRTGELDAARAALSWARDGDLLVLPIHDKHGRNEVIALLDRLAALRWQPGQALP